MASTRLRHQLSNRATWLQLVQLPQLVALLQQAKSCWYISSSRQDAAISSDGGGFSRFLEDAMRIHARLGSSDSFHCSICTRPPTKLLKLYKPPSPWAARTATRTPHRPRRSSSRSPCQRRRPRRSRLPRHSRRSSSNRRPRSSSLLPRTVRVRFDRVYDESRADGLVVAQSSSPRERLACAKSSRTSALS